jgi:hypothetical protein
MVSGGFTARAPAFTSSIHGACPKVSQSMIDSFVKNLGGTPVHNLQIAYSDCANVPIASIINANARDVYADHSLGRNLTDADVANDQWLKERGGNLKSFLRGCNLR